MQQVLEWFSDDCRVFGFGLKGGLLSSNRDFVVGEVYANTQSGLVVMRRSLKSSLGPEVRGYVRGEIKFSGFHVSPISNSYGSKLVYVSFQYHEHEIPIS